MALVPSQRASVKETEQISSWDAEFGGPQLPALPNRTGFRVEVRILPVPVTGSSRAAKGPPVALKGFFLSSPFALK